MLLVTPDNLSRPRKHQDFLPVCSALLGNDVQVVVVTAAVRVSRAREPNNNNARDNLTQTLLSFFTSFITLYTYTARQPTLTTITMHTFFFITNKVRNHTFFPLT